MVNKLQITIFNSLAIAGLFLMINPNSLKELILSLFLFMIAMFLKPSLLDDAKEVEPVVGSKNG